MQQFDDAANQVDNAMAKVVGDGERQPLVAWLLWFFLGGLGGHNFYLRRTKQGLMQAGLFVASAVLTMILIGALGFLALFVWWVMDAIKMGERIEAANGGGASDAGEIAEAA
ncbi:MAG: TM2 domain-containing protein [Planctomycetota bacterium]